MSKKLTIGLFSDAYFPNTNGVTTSVFALQKGLEELGHEAWVIAPSVPRYRDHVEHVLRLKSVPFPFYKELRFVIPAPGSVTMDFDVIHTHTISTLGGWGASLAKRKRIPHVSTFHTHLEEYLFYIPYLEKTNQHTNIAKKIIKGFYNRADVVIAPTQPIADLLRSYRIDREIQVIPTGIDMSVLEASEPVFDAWPEGKRRLISISRLGAEKSVDHVLEAFKRLQVEHDAHLLIVGDGPARADYEKLAKDLRIDKAVTFVGQVPYEQVGGYLKAAEIFMFASASETQGLVCLEAQAMRTPVVAVGCQGTLKAVRDHVTGFLVDVGDSQALAARTSELLSDDALLERFSEQARAVFYNHNHLTFARATLQQYERVLRRPLQRLTPWWKPI